MVSFFSGLVSGVAQRFPDSMWVLSIIKRALRGRCWVVAIAWILVFLHIRAVKIDVRTNLPPGPDDRRDPFIYTLN